MRKKKGKITPTPSTPTPLGTSQFRGIFFANMGGGGGQNYFHDRSSREPLLKKKWRPQPYWGGENSGFMLWSLQMPCIIGFRVSQRYY